MEGKYGRLFTEGDLEMMLVLGRELEHLPPGDFLEARQWIEEVTKLVNDRAERITTTELRFTFPADEPLFLLRGQDKAAPGTISGYLMCACAAGASIEHASAARKAGRAMAEWQAEHPDRVKVPD